MMLLINPVKKAKVEQEITNESYKYCMMEVFDSMNLSVFDDEKYLRFKLWEISTTSCYFIKKVSC